MNLDKIYEIDELDELGKAIRKMDQKTLYKALYKDYLRLVEYKDANEWNQLVHICEIFSIIGWGSLERLDAICFRVQNKWQTELKNRYKENRFLKGVWLKRKNGLILIGHSYYHSPDKPDKPSIISADYPETQEIECQVPKLLDQRNKQKTNPIVFGGLYSLDTKITRQMLFPILLSLQEILDNNLAPENYGDGIADISIYYITAPPKNKDKSHFKIGKYLFKKRMFEGELYFGEEFASLSAIKRKILIKSLLLEVLKDLALTVVKKKINYDIKLLTSDVIKEVDKWIGG